ncbi:MAG TPA: hypothetical protein VKH37_05835, partial [Ferruginibacter sp.]|nr:hypothetical protein [Ferruginibacter sp.]
TDENDNPVTGASIAVGSATTSTDKFGYFEVKNISVVKNVATVTVSKSDIGAIGSFVIGSFEEY